MKIVVKVELPYDNEIQFFDVCKGISEKLTELGTQALNDGDHEQFIGVHVVQAANDDERVVGTIRITQ